MNNRFLSFPSDDQLQHHNWWHADQSVPENPRRCSMEHALSVTEILQTHVKKCLNPPATVGPGHILAERHFVILLSMVAFTLPLSLYRNIEKLGKVSLNTFQLHLFQPSGPFLAACKPPVGVSRCPCCRWCWPWPSSSPWSSELPR